ncbi:MAG: sensor histidine kinase, partial [Anaerolineales bacterium]|nr:sensor histidine kinase [Anaerolineales bacterium]
LRPLLEQAAAALAAGAQARQVTVQVAAAEPLPAITGDADRLLEVLLNLLDNALQYTPPGGQIDLAVEADPAAGEVVVHVRDTGPGIPPDVLPHLFDRFRRGDVRRSGSGLNLGLGLNIAQAIVAAHGGTLQAANRAGGGADFYFNLRAAPP